jgi:hypothetical protein
MSIDPNNLESFKFPMDLLEKVYELTGDSHSSSKGFMLAYTDQNGAPMIYSKFGSQIVDMGIRKALEKYLIEIENVDSPFDISDDQE